MKLSSTPPAPPAQSWDLFRLTKSKREVDISSNTLRSYNAQGLRFYRVNGAVFVSRSELDHFIRSRAE